MSLPVELEASTELLRRLGAASDLEILNRDYQDITPENDINRAEVARYSHLLRGSIRLATGRFYTAREMKERIERDSALPVLP